MRAIGPDSEKGEDRNAEHILCPRAGLQQDWESAAKSRMVSCVYPISME